MGLLDQMMANLYKPAKQEKPVQALPKHLTPAKVAHTAAQTTVSQGQLLTGEVLDLRANQIMVLLENGTTVSARTEGTLNLSIGQTARFFVAQTTEEQILLKLAKEDTPGENPMIDKALSAANITKTERSISIVSELLSHQQPVTESNIRHYLSLSAKHPEFPVKDLVLMELHHIPVTKENVEQFAGYHNRNSHLLTQAQDILQNLTETIAQLPEGALKQEALHEMTKLLISHPENTAVSETTALHQTPMPEPSAIVQEGQTLVSEDRNIPTATPADIPEAQTNLSEMQTNLTETQIDLPETQTSLPNPQASSGDMSAGIHNLPMPERSARSEIDLLSQDFLNSFLLNPEDVADPEKVQRYYDELDEKLTKLEHLSQKLAETTKETSLEVPKQMRSNLSFMEAVNQVFPYVQLPLKFRETPAHGELYVYEKKKALKPSDTLSALLHLELEALGTTDIFVTLSGNHVTTRFSMTNKESGDLIRAELPKLTEALAAKGYTLQSEVAVQEPKEKESTPTLLEQFLEEHAPGGLNRYTFDIRA